MGAVGVSARVQHERLCLIVPYFGRWPFWFDFFLASCRWNPGIDWLFFTDCGMPATVPPNVRFVEIGFAEYCQQVSERLNIRFMPENAYKLCDLKPALGEIHADELADYDYFGFGDVDVIWGDLQGWLYPRLHNHDCVSTHATRISGHLCAFRNTQALRTAFRHAPQWKSCLENPRHTRFDEAQFSKVFLRYKNWPAWFRRCMDCTDMYRRRALFEECFSTPGCRISWHDGSRRFPSAWFCTPDGLRNDIDGERTFPYLHFLDWKRGWKNASPHSAYVRTSADADLGWRLSEQGFDSPVSLQAN